MFPTFRILPLALVMSTALALLACDRDEPARPIAPPAPAPATGPDYTPLTIGSYWVYEVWDLPANGAPRLNPLLDSTVVIGDTVVRGHHYAIVSDQMFGFRRRQLQRDSADYLINDKGGKLFSSTDFSRPLSYSIYDFGSGHPDTLQVCQMANRDSIVSVPAITSPTYDNRGTINPALCVAATLVPYNHHFYAPNVGLIKDVCCYCSLPPYQLERRLLRYHIAPAL